MEIKNLKTFLQVAESGSFTRAAEILNYTQSTVSFQINQLEEELGCLLFDRIGHSIELTSRGKQLLQHALAINNSLQSLVEDFSQEEKPAGTVHLYSSDSICEQMVLRNYAEFYQTYPDINLILSTGSTKDLLEVLDKNEADVIFTLDNHVYRPNFIIAKESPVKMVFVCSADNPITKEKNLTIQKVIQYPLILTESGMSYRKVFDDYLAQMSIAVQPVLETGRTDVITRSLVHSKAISFLPEFAVKDALDQHELISLNVKEFDITIWKQLIYRKDKWISKPFRAFLDFVIAHEFEW